MMNRSIARCWQKWDELNNFFYPNTHTVSIHHSHININVIFYIRLISFIYITGIYLWALATTPTLLFEIIYLTMQGYFLTWLYFLLVMQDYLLNGYSRWGKIFPTCDNLKYYIQIIYQTAICIQIPITIIFWGFLFKILLDSNVSTQIIIVNANLHAGPLICLVLDYVYNVYEFPKCHFFVIVFYGTLYMVLNLIYSLTVKVIYKPIDWVSFLSYLLAISAYLLAFLMHWGCRFCFERFKKKRLDTLIMQGLIEANKNELFSIESQQKGIETINNRKTQIEEDQNKSIITEND